MSATTISTSTPTARKRHGCQNCGGTIAIGDRYVNERTAYEGTVGTFKSHRLCEVFWREALAAEPYITSDDWTWEIGWQYLREWWTEFVATFAPVAGGGE